jgi:hypothetical protein
LIYANFFRKNVIKNREWFGIASGMTREWFGEVGEKWKNPPGPLSKEVTIEKDFNLSKNA